VVFNIGDLHEQATLQLDRGLLESEDGLIVAYLILLAESLDASSLLPLDLRWRF
jgi:hypothetical protein